jgi:hypothetical protein
MRISVFKPSQTHAREPSHGEVTRFLVGHGPKLQPGRHVVERAAPWHQRLSLEHIAGAPVDAEQRLAKHPKLPGRWLQQAGSQIQQRRFAAAGGAHHGDELAGLHLQRGVLDGGVTLAWRVG